MVDLVKRQVIETTKRAFRKGSLYHGMLPLAARNAYHTIEGPTWITIVVRTENGPRSFEIKVTEKV